MGGAPDPATGGVTRPVALLLSTVTFLALMVAGLSMLSVLTGRDIIAAALGPLAGVAGAAAAVVVFAGMLWLSLRRAHPSFWGSAWTTAAVFIAYVAGVGIAGIAATQDLVAATAAAGRLVTAGFAPLTAAAALVCAWGGIALVRTGRSHRPRWPWEHDDEP